MGRRASVTRRPNADGPMSQRQVLKSLSGLLLGMFVSILAGTAVATLLPLIVSDLEGDQSAYTWVVTGTLLATTVSTPVWGKFADLFNRKLLIQLALVVFVLGSALAGFSQDTGTLIAFRILQGLRQRARAGRFPAARLPAQRHVAWFSWACSCSSSEPVWA